MEPITVQRFISTVRAMCYTALELNIKPTELVINPEILYLMSKEEDFYKLHEFSQSRIVQESPKLRFLRISDTLVLTLVEQRSEFMFHLR